MHSKIKDTLAKNKKPHLKGGKREIDFDNAGFEHADFCDSEEEKYANEKQPVEKEEQEKHLNIVSLFKQISSE